MSSSPKHLLFMLRLLLFVTIYLFFIWYMIFHYWCFCQMLNVNSRYRINSSTDLWMQHVTISVKLYRLCGIIFILNLPSAFIPKLRLTHNRLSQLMASDDSWLQRTHFNWFCVRGTHRWQLDSRHKGPMIWRALPWYHVITDTDAY